MAARAYDGSVVPRVARGGDGGRRRGFLPLGLHQDPLRSRQDARICPPLRHGALQVRAGGHVPSEHAEYLRREDVVASVSKEEQRAAMADLRRFIELSRERGELEVVKGADPYLEMGALYELSLRKRYPPVLLFEDIKGYPATHRVVMNVRFSRLFVGDLDMAALKALRKRPKGTGDSIPPQYVNTGPICDTVVKGDAVDIRA